MKRFCCFLAVLLLFCGCGRSEALPEFPDTGEALSQYIPVISAPACAVLESDDGDLDRQYYEAEDGEFEIAVLRLPGYRPETALELLTGRKKDELALLRTERQGMEEYRFQWTAEEEAPYEHTCILLSDHFCCYAVVFSTVVTAARRENTVKTAVLSSFHLEERPGK